MFSTLKVLLALVLATTCLLVDALPAAKPQLVVNEQRATSTHVNLDPYAGKPRVTFRKDGTFKITVFSDLHFGENPWDAWGPEQDVNSTRLMRTVLRDEQPDYVVINGDLITGENTFRENSTNLINEIMIPINEAQVKFSSTYGNHDNEANITHFEEIQRELEVAPRSYTRLAPPGVGGEEGPGNYWVPVYTKERDAVPSLVMWFFDSRGGFNEGTGTVAVPDWVDKTVADWVERETTAMNDAWGPPEDRAALAFVHIPPHFIQPLQTDLNSTQDPGLNADLLGSGSTQATTAASSAGNDDPFWNSLNANVKNLHAVISGHGQPPSNFMQALTTLLTRALLLGNVDHGNEWCKREPTKNVIFCFDKHSGYGGYSGTGWGHGVRNIVFSSPHPQGSLDTWIRLEEAAAVTIDTFIVIVIVIFLAFLYRYNGDRLTRKLRYWTRSRPLSRRRAKKAPSNGGSNRGTVSDLEKGQPMDENALVRILTYLHNLPRESNEVATRREASLRSVGRLEGVREGGDGDTRSVCESVGNCADVLKEFPRPPDAAYMRDTCHSGCSASENKKASPDKDDVTAPSAQMHVGPVSAPLTGSVLTNAKSLGQINTGTSSKTIGGHCQPRHSSVPASKSLPSANSPFLIVSCERTQPKAWVPGDETYTEFAYL
ncbi:hypothetical protein EW145_g5704 [Phellinidium pouzarii]|uniref:Calcineurin-like phosphoesterase domain-containing protein n=1 Tax=Phellinidium pouzarii TaxID=167371 RepID=A0A4S4KZB8_9AGAM|nr:hypothetical protein EW145_g5704 [Phellinidium pouzarii]